MVVSRTLNTKKNIFKTNKIKMEEHERPRYLPRCISFKISLAIISILLGIMGFTIFGCFLKNWNAGIVVDDVLTIYNYSQLQRILIIYLRF